MKRKIRLIILCVISGVMWTGVLWILGNIFSKNTDIPLKDILFMEGVLTIILGIFSAVEGNPMGLSMQSFGQNNAQYVANANLEITRREKEKMVTKDRIKIGTSTISLVLGGIGCIVIQHMI